MTGRMATGQDRLRFWAVAAAFGLLAEIGRAGFGASGAFPSFDRAAGNAALVLAGYPLLFAAAVRLHALLRRRSGTITALSLTWAILASLGAAFNADARVWPGTGGDSTLALAGLLALATVTAVAAWSVQTGTMRATAQDGLGWRLARVGIVAILRDAMRRVLEARTVPGPGGPIRPMRPDIDRLADRLEPGAARLRPGAGLDGLPGIGNRLMVELAVFTTGSYRLLLDEGFAPAAAREIVADAGWLVYARMLRLASLPWRMVSRDPGFRLRGTIRSLLRFPFHAPGAPGYAVETRIEGGDIFTHFTLCPPHSFVRALVARDDRGDLDAFRDNWCTYDFPGADLIAADGRRGHYTRPRTLSHGDAVCDMCWRARPSDPPGPVAIPADSRTIQRSIT